jgi:hypothetical protein
MTTHAYPTAALAGDYARAAGGLALVGAPLALLDLPLAAVLVLSALALLFLVFGIRTALRQMSRVELSDEAIAACGPLAARVDWDALDDVRLRYYATRRDRKNGWMQLVLGSGGRRLSLDSTIDGFDVIARRAACAAIQRHLVIGTATAENFAALGIRLTAGEA